MRKERIQGIGSIPKGEYDAITIEGICKIKGNVVCNQLNVQGLLKTKGKVNTQIFNCEGMIRSFDDIKAKEVKFEGVLKVRGAKLESDLINCEGMIVCNKEISSDEIYIKGLCSVKKMYGDIINIKRECDHMGKVNINIPNAIVPFCHIYFGREISDTHSLVDIIECTELVADNLKAELVKAHNITLGENCEINRIECTGEIKYPDSCKIKELNAKIINNEDEDKCKKGFENNTNESVVKVYNMVNEGIITKEEGQKMITSIERKIQ